MKLPWHTASSRGSVSIAASLERYYTVAGAPRTFDPSVHTTLADCLDQDGQHRPDLAGPAVTEWIAVVLARYLRPPPDSSHWSGHDTVNGIHEPTDIPLTPTMEGARP